MTQQSAIERAKVLNAASLQAKSALAVVATLEAERPTVETATYKCSACTTVFATNAGTEPFCIACGSHHVHAEATASIAPQVLPADAELAAFVCSADGIYNVLSNARLPELKSHAHCVACGTAHNFDLQAEAQDDADEQVQDQGSQQGDQQGDQQQEQAQSDEELNADPQAPAVQQQAEDQGQQPTQQQQAPQQQQANDQQTQVETVPLDDDEVLQQSGDQYQGQQGQQQDQGQAVELSLLATALAADPKAQLELHHAGTAIFAMVNGLHVATLKADAKPELAGVFDKKSFATSILHMAGTEGVAQALKSYGFESSVIKVPMSPVMSALVKKGVQTQVQELSTKTAELSESMKQCLSIAAVGLNKGFWRSKSNPLKVAMAQALASLNVSNPNRMVANIWSSAGDAYVKTLLEAALELSSKSAEYRNELSASLQDMGIQVEAGTEEPEEETASVYEVPAKPVKSAVTASTAVAPGNVSSIGAIRRSVGTRSLFSTF